MYSDHCALSFSLTNRTVNKHTQQRCSYPVVYRWDPSKQPIYCEKLLNTECTKIYENLLCKTIDIDRDPRSAIGIFDDYMNTAINGLFHKRKVVNTNDSPRNKWFDDECKSAKRKLHGMPKKYMTENDRNAYNELMREYKALIQRKKTEILFSNCIWC